jgi:hypothetical protein
MRLRLFVPLLVGALAACDGGTTLPVEQKLVGSWRSNQETVGLNFPDGPHEVAGMVNVEFTADRRFHREWLVTDPSAPDRMIPQDVEEGTYTVSGRSVLLHVERSYDRGPAAPAAQVTLEPNDRTDEYRVAVAGTWMSLTFVCPGWMDCLPPMFTEYQQTFLYTLF